MMRWLRRGWRRAGTPRTYDGAMPDTDISIVHREGQAFEAWVEGQHCVAEYQRQGQVVRMSHTVVPPALEGRGIAGRLVEAALSWAQAEGLKVDAQCSYVQGYLQRHPQWRHLQV